MRKSKRSSKSQKPISYSYQDIPPVLREMAEAGMVNILPAKPGTKKSKYDWKHYQKKRFSIKRLKKHRGNFLLIMGGCGHLGINHLTVIDIDDVEHGERIYNSLKDLDTLIVKTPRKGWQIYLWSEKKVEKKNQIGSQFGLELEIRGKRTLLCMIPPSHVIYTDGFQGHHKLIKTGSKDPIKYVDDVESLVTQRLKDAGFEVKTSSEVQTVDVKETDGIEEYIIPPGSQALTTFPLPGSVKDIIDILEPIYKEGQRQNVVLALSGWFRKAEVDYEDAKQVIKCLSSKEHPPHSELKTRLSALNSSYNTSRKARLLGGSYIYSALKEYNVKLFQNDEDASEKAFNKTKNEYNRLIRLIEDPESYASIKRLIGGMNDKGMKIPTIKKIAWWIQKRYWVFKDDKTSELHIYNPGDLYYKQYTEHEFHAFLSELFPEKIFLKRETDDMMSAISIRGSETTGIIAFNNGWLDTESRELIDPSGDYYVKLHIPYNYNPSAYSGRMDNFLDQVFADEEGRPKRSGFLEYLGYCIIERGNPFNKMLLLYGKPGTGKSTVINLVKAIFINSMASIPLQDFKDRFGSQGLIGKRVNIMYDLPSAAITDLGKIKAMTGEDPMTLDRKYKDPITVTEHPKPIGTANQLPPIKSTGDGFYERLVLIEMNNQFRGTEKDQPGLVTEITRDQEAMEYLIKESIEAYLTVEKTNIWSMQLTTEEIRDEYLKNSDPCLYAASQVFTCTNDENDYLTTGEAHELIKKILKTLGLRVPRDIKHYSKAISAIGCDKAKIRLDKVPKHVYTMIKVKQPDKSADVIEDEQTVMTNEYHVTLTPLLEGLKNKELNTP